MYSFIVDAAKEEFSKAQRRFMGYLAGARIAQDLDATAQLNDDQTKVVLADGTEFKAIVSGSPTKVDGAIRLSENSFYVQHQVVKSMFTGGGRTPWYIVGLYPTDKSVPEFPIFNLIDGNSMNQYYIPLSMTPELYDTTPLASNYINFGWDLNGANGADLSTGYDGRWYVRLSPDAKTIILVRVQETLDREFTEDGAYVGNRLTGIDPPVRDRYEWGIKAYTKLVLRYATITGFVLDTDGHTLTSNDDTVITEGTQTIEYDFATVDVTNTMSPNIFSTGGSAFSVDQSRTVTTTFLGFGGFPDYTYSLSGKPVIWQNEDGEVKVDFVGAWSGVGGSYAAYFGTDTPPVFGSIMGPSGRTVLGCANNVTVPTYPFTGNGGMSNYSGTISVAGLFTIEDIFNSTTIQSNSFSTSGGSYVTTGLPVELAQAGQTGNHIISDFNITGLVPLTHANTLKATSSLTPGNLDFAYRDKDGSALIAYTTRDTNYGVADSARQLFFRTPYLSTSGPNIPFLGSRESTYIGDNTTQYMDSNSTTSWWLNYNTLNKLPRIKTYAAGKFWELIYTLSIMSKIKLWKYDSDTETIIEDGEEANKTYEDPLVVYGDAEATYLSSLTTFTIMDFTVAD